MAKITEQKRQELVQEKATIYTKLSQIEAQLSNDFGGKFKIDDNGDLVVFNFGGISKNQIPALIAWLEESFDIVKVK